MVIVIIKVKVIECIKMCICKGDIVQVIVGKDKGKIGVVLCILFNENCVVVEGVNMCICYEKFIQEGEIGCIVMEEVFLYVFNVMLYFIDKKVVSCVEIVVEKDGIKKCWFKKIGEVFD